jgi:hypothetical protein
VESNWVHSALQPRVGLLCQPRVIRMMEKLMEWWLAGETEVLGENMTQCRFAHHKLRMLNPGHRGGKPATNRLSYGTAEKDFAVWSYLSVPQFHNSSSQILWEIILVSVGWEAEWVSVSNCLWWIREKFILICSLFKGTLSNSDSTSSSS